MALVKIVTDSKEIDFETNKVLLAGGVFTVVLEMWWRF